MSDSGYVSTHTWYKLVADRRRYLYMSLGVTDVAIILHGYLGIVCPPLTLVTTSISQPSQ